MSELSESCYSAGWMKYLEYVLWEATINGERNYGTGRISNVDISTLLQLSRNCNCWIYFDDVKEETTIDLEDWKELYKNSIAKNSNIIKRF